MNKNVHDVCIEMSNHAKSHLFCADYRNFEESRSNENSPSVVTETASVCRSEDAFSVYPFLSGIAGTHYLPTLKSGEQIAREKEYRTRELRRRRR